MTRSCKADFDGDGKPGEMVVDNLTPPTQWFPAAHSWLVAFDGGQELFRIPYRYRDNTLRTHVALVHDSGRARLLVFDGIKQGDAPPNGALEWDGGRLGHVEPSSSDLNILAAMRARDDAGNWNGWVLFRLFSLLLALLYYLPLTLIIISRARRGHTAGISRKLP